MRDRATVTGRARPRISAIRHAHGHFRWRKPILQIADASACFALFLFLVLILA